MATLLLLRLLLLCDSQCSLGLPKILLPGFFYRSCPSEIGRYSWMVCDDIEMKHRIVGGHFCRRGSPGCPGGP